MIPPGQVTTLPHYDGQGCYTLNIVPTDYVTASCSTPRRPTSTRARHDAGHPDLGHLDPLRVPHARPDEGACARRPRPFDIPSRAAPSHGAARGYRPETTGCASWR